MEQNVVLGLSSPIKKSCAAIQPMTTSLQKTDSMLDETTDSLPKESQETAILCGDPMNLDDSDDIDSSEMSSIDSDADVSAASPFTVASQRSVLKRPKKTNNPSRDEMKTLLMEIGCEAIKCVQSKLQSSDDTCTAYGVIVADTMRKLPSLAQLRARVAINEILLMFAEEYPECFK